jgi:hypothetical protein
LAAWVEDSPLEVIALAAAEGHVADPPLYLGFGEWR